jgi:hypothetical protein
MSSQQNVTKILFVVVMVLIVFIYVHYYSKYNDTYEIVQTYLDKVNIDMLYERNPIVIYDSIKTPKQLLGTLFKYSYVSKSEYKINTKYPVMNRAKFSFVYSTSNEGNGGNGGNADVYINLINPSYKTSMKWENGGKKQVMDKVSTTSLEETNVQYITIKLKPYQVVIIPMHWIIQTDAPLMKYNLDDFVSLVYFKFW